MLALIVLLDSSDLLLRFLFRVLLRAELYWTTAAIFVGVGFFQLLRTGRVGGGGPRSSLDLGDAEEHEYTGVYIPHWQVGRFMVAGTEDTERWLPVIPEAEVQRHQLDLGDSTGSGKTYRMRVRGKKSARGLYGFQGICCRELIVSEILECSRN